MFHFLMGVVVVVLLVASFVAWRRMMITLAELLAWAVEVEQRRSPRVRRWSNGRVERLAAWHSRKPSERRAAAPSRRREDRR